MPLSTLRILLVDDFEPLRYLKSLQLRKTGALILEAKTGREALKILETQAVDVALLDINLPDMSAIELGETMLADKAMSGIPVIYTSASDRPEKLSQDAVFFQEPIEQAELVRTIKRMLRRAASESA